jgi:hypothetical protein
VYPLGLYLGDGHLVTSAKVPVLRVACADKWPGLIEQCEAAMLAVLAARVWRMQKVACTSVESTARHWPCLFPQHGPGKKHERSIVLADWQREFVAAHPGHFVRGQFTVRGQTGRRCGARPACRAEIMTGWKKWAANRVGGTCDRRTPFCS